MRATCIDWETDGETPELPEEMQIPDEIDPEDVADYLSDQTGWLVNGFSLEPDERILHAQAPVTFLPEHISWELYRLETPGDLADVCRALYGSDAADIDCQAAELQNADYPCWALFSVDSGDNGGNRCLGPAKEIIDELSEILADAMRGR